MTTEKYIFDNKRWLKDIRDARVTLGYSFRFLASHTPHGPSYWFSIFAGKTDPRMDDFIVLCRVLELPAIEYFDVKEYQKRMF